MFLSLKKLISVGRRSYDLQLEVTETVQVKHSVISRQDYLSLTDCQTQSIEPVIPTSRLSC